MPSVDRITRRTWFAAIAAALHLRPHVHSAFCNCATGELSADSLRQALQDLAAMQAYPLHTSLCHPKFTDFFTQNMLPAINRKVWDTWGKKL